MNMQAYMAFLKDFEIIVDKARAVEVYKKSGINH